MRKPSNYDKVETNTGWKPLDLGGHYLKILTVEETISKSGNEMLVITYDTSKKDKQPGYFLQNHTKGRYYQGTHYIMLTENEWAVRNLKQFITSVENSNPGFKFDWDNEQSLVGREVGGVFGEEEYLNQQGEVKTSTRLRWFCGIEKVEDQIIPDRKELSDADLAKAKVDRSGLFDLSGTSSDDMPFDI